ncbi:MAG: hypothetical protein R3C68_19945 [Myxococcota bacterium]
MSFKGTTKVLTPETTTPGWVNFVVAHKGEAQPLIEHYGFKRCKEGAFTIYRSDDHTHLILSGPGKIAAASATAYLFAILGEHRDMAWINFGCGGHRDMQVGEVCHAIKISEHNSDRTWYPQSVLPHVAQAAELMTVDIAEKDFATTAVYEMEAAGYFALASRLSSVELVHSLKVITDNRQTPWGTPKQAAKTMHTLLAPCIALEQGLRQLSNEVTNRSNANHELASTFFSTWHFTRTQQIQLGDLLRRFTHLCPETCAVNLTKDQRDAKGVLDQLTTATWHAAREFKLSS